MSVDAATILLARHEQLRTRAGAAATVLRLVDDPDAGAQDLARALGTDPVLAARVLRVANSSYYGLSGRVGTLPFAVSVLGFQTVRSLAVVAAAGLDDPSSVPTGFWPAAALAATAAERIAPLLEADAGDAFSLGLLHTFGAALLHQHEPLDLLCLPAPADPDELLRTEHERYGINHQLAGARVLAAWHVPERITSLIARHHQAPLPDAAPLERALHASRYLTGVALGAGEPAPGDADLAWITDGLIGEEDVPGLVIAVRERAQSLLEGLQPRGR